MHGRFQKQACLTPDQKAWPRLAPMALPMDEQKDELLKSRNQMGLRCLTGNRWPDQTVYLRAELMGELMADQTVYPMHDQKPMHDRRPCPMDELKGELLRLQRLSRLRYQTQNE